MNLERKFLSGFSNLEDEVINQKDVITRKFQEQNAKLRSIVKVLENKFSRLEQYSKHSNTVVSGFPDSDNELECFVIKIMKTIYIKTDDSDTEASLRIGKSKRNSKK